MNVVDCIPGAGIFLSEIIICSDVLFIYLTGSCFEIPTCYDQEKLDFWDTLLPGDTLFEMKHPDPAYHFPDFNDWDRLSWTIDQNNYLDVAEVVEIEKNRGITCKRL